MDLSIQQSYATRAQLSRGNLTLIQMCIETIEAVLHRN